MFRSLSRLHRDERGIKTLEAVALLALAAIALVAIRAFWNKIAVWFRDSSKDATNNWETGQ